MLQQCRSLLNCGNVDTFLDRATLVDRVITGVGSGIFTRPYAVHGMAVVPIWPVSRLVLVRAAIVDQREGLTSLDLDITIGSKTIFTVRF